MPAPGTNGTIPGIMYTVAGFLKCLANNSPKIPTTIEAKKSSNYITI